MSARQQLPDLTGTPPGGHPLALAVMALFAVAMAFMESTIVVYLRELYYPDGFVFPLKDIPHHILLVEVVREAATLVMLCAASWFAGRRLAERFAMFCYAFALWDIFYYIWLKVTLGWPASLFTWDVLFLIPIPWLGPVISPLIVSVSLLAGALIIFKRLGMGGVFHPNWRELAIAAGGAWLILLSYLVNLEASFGKTAPEIYRWELMVVGIAAGFYALMRSLYRTAKEAGEWQAGS